jgi:hypothetical protein
MNRLAPAILVALALLLPAGARADAVDGGHLHLKLRDALTKAFRQEGVRLIGLGPAKASKAGVTLPISEGQLEQRYGSGFLFLDGGFRLRVGRRTATVRNLVLDTNRHALRGKVNGIAMKIAEPSFQHVAIDGFDLDLSLKALRLTARAASMLNGRLGLHGVFVVRHSLAAAAAVATFETLAVRSGDVSFTVDPGFREKLASIDADVLSVAPAKLVGVSPTVVSMPITGGQIAPDLSLGVLLGDGGLKFIQHDTPFDHGIAFVTTSVGFDSKLVSGVANVAPNPKQVPYGAPLGSFPSGPTGLADPATGEISATAPIALWPEFAALLNEVLGAPKGRPDYFSAGEILGSLGFRVQTR